MQIQVSDHGHLTSTDIDIHTPTLIPIFDTSSYDSYHDYHLACQTLQPCTPTCTVSSVNSCGSAKVTV